MDDFHQKSFHKMKLKLLAYRFLVQKSMDDIADNIYTSTVRFHTASFDSFGSHSHDIWVYATGMDPKIYPVLRSFLSVTSTAVFNPEYN